MVNYKDLGLVNTREMFAKAIKEATLSQHSTSTTWSNRLLSKPLLKLNHRLFFKYQKALATTPTRLFSATWQKAL